MIWSIVMPVTFTVSAGKPASAAVDVLVVPTRQRQLAFAHLPAGLRRAVRQQVRQLSFTGAPGSAELFPVSVSGVRASFVAVVGLGSAGRGQDDQVESMRRGVGTVVQEARRHGLHRVAVLLADELHAPELAVGVVDGITLSAYRFTEYSARMKREAAARELRQVSLLVTASQTAAVRRVLRREQDILAGVSLARDLVNRPAAAATPQALVDIAEGIRKRSRNVSLRVLNRQDAEAEGFSAFLAVARGSEEEPYVIHLTYTSHRRAADRANTKKIFLVGKGITFDSGGLSLKPAEGMETMKIDMAGAATVLGVFSVLSSLQIDVEVHGVIAACENMPSGKAYRPGDVLTAKNGKTIEVLNTDAEGRVTLADALSYAVEHKPDAVIDLATLTGACVVALGETYAGLWSTKDELAQRLLVASRATGEGLVQMPLPDEYRPMIESKVADVRNTSTTRWGGAITAALFLREFVGATPWAHLDIAGPSYAEREWLSYQAVGGTGYGVRTLIDFLENYETKE